MQSVHGICTSLGYKSNTRQTIYMACSSVGCKTPPINSCYKSTYQTRLFAQVLQSDKVQPSFFLPSSPCTSEQIMLHEQHKNMQTRHMCKYKTQACNRCYEGPPPYCICYIQSPVRYQGICSPQSNWQSAYTITSIKLGNR